MELPIDLLIAEIKNQPNPQLAYSNILYYGENALISPIWSAFKQVNLNRDIAAAQEWIQKELNQHPTAKGIYLGLDTGAMGDGEGYNVEIGFSSDCIPTVIDMDWAYSCDAYGNSHLIKSLFELSDAFLDDEKYTSDECSFAEYVIFLGYSGIVLREALLRVVHTQDFLSVWGFHDGDMFYLIQSIDKDINIISDLPS